MSETRYFLDSNVFRKIFVLSHASFQVGFHQIWLCQFPISITQLAMKSVKQTESLLLIWLQIAIASKIIFSGKVSTSSVDSSAKIGDHFEFDSDSDEEILVKPELFSMTEANLCSILIDRFNFPANGSDDESTNVFTKTSIFGGKNEPFVSPIDEHILSELESVINNKKGQGNRQEIVFDYCIGKANGGLSL